MNGQTTPVRVLIVENSEDDAELVIDHLQQAGFEVSFERVETSEEMTRALRDKEWDVVVSDFMMPAFTGLEALQIAQQFDPNLPFIIASGSIGEDLAVQAMRAGAHDYLMKDRMARLGAAVHRQIQESRIRRERNQMEVENRRQAEELRARAEQLARSNAELEKFAYLAAHDLQEPLRMVTAFAELFVKRYHEKLDPDADTLLGFIQTGVDRMEMLIRGLLEYSKTLHEEPPNLCPVSLEEVVDEAIRACESAIAEQGATVKRDVLPSVLGCGEKLGGVFEQLIRNALKFRKPDVTPAIDISAERTAEEVVVKVRDNGIGIDAQYWDQVFGLFKRLHRQEELGLGIGLALSRRTVEQQGGRIWVESILGEGATFFIALRPA